MCARRIKDNIHEVIAKFILVFILAKERDLTRGMPFTFNCPIEESFLSTLKHLYSTQFPFRDIS